MAAFRFIYMESDNVAGVSEMVRTVMEWQQVVAGPPRGHVLAVDDAPAERPALPAPRKVRKPRQPRAAATAVKRAKPVAVNAPKRREFNATPAAGGRRGTAAETREARVLASLEYLRQHGPSNKSHVAKACGFTPTYMSSLCRDKRFVEVNRGLLWIAGEPDEPIETEDDDRPVDAPVAAGRMDAPTVATLQKAIRMCGPLTLKEIASYVECSEADCFRVLAGDATFERDTDGLYWVKK